MQLDDIHCGHGQSCTVDHAAYFSIQPNVVQICLGRSNLWGAYKRKKKKKKTGGSPQKSAKPGTGDHLSQCLLWRRRRDADLAGILLSRVSEGKYFLLAECRIVIKVQLCVGGYELVVSRLGHWVDLRNRNQDERVSIQIIN